MALTSTGTNQHECQTNQLQYEKGLSLLRSAPRLLEKSTPGNTQGPRWHRNCQHLPPWHSICPHLVSTNICNLLASQGRILTWRTGAAQIQKVISPCKQHCFYLRGWALQAACARISASSRGISPAEDPHGCSKCHCVPPGLVWAAWAPTIIENWQAELPTVFWVSQPHTLTARGLNWSFNTQFSYPDSKCFS